MTRGMSRRQLFALTTVLVAASGSTLPVFATDTIHVVKDPGCGCCGAWIDHPAAEGFASTVEIREAGALDAHKRRMGIPPALASCHTATVGAYVVEGHVPAADIRRLLAEAPTPSACRSRACPTALLAWGRRRNAGLKTWC